MKETKRFLTAVFIIAAAACVSCSQILDFGMPERVDTQQDIVEVETVEVEVEEEAVQTDVGIDTPRDPDAEQDGVEDPQQEDAADGEEDAEVETGCGNGIVETGEDCDDGDENSDTEPDHCRRSCRDPGCGDSVTDSGEQCDDGRNGDDTDGCTDLCRFTCEEGGNCSDGEVCNGDEPCDTIAHRCGPGTPAADGFVCNVDPRSICLAGSCGLSTCGDDFVDTGGGEFCEPSLDARCRPDCTYACMVPSDCPDDLDACNGEEYCEAATNTCSRRNPLPDGTDCDVSPAVREICLGETCQASACGDRFIDAGSTPPEECDDGNPDNADGCRTDCTFTCHVPTQEVECDDGHDCTDDLCDPALHTCGSSPASASTVCRPASGQPCDVAELCNGTDADCPANGFAGNTVECRASAGQCDAAELCSGTSEACPADLPVPDGTGCIDGDACTTSDICTSGSCAGTFAGDTICNNHGTCNSSGTPPCTCSAGYAGQYCDQCAAGYVFDPTTPGRCIADPCLGVTCSAPDVCNAAYTAVVRTTGACIVLGEGSYRCETAEIACAPWVCSGGACVEAYAPATGDLVVNEIMIDPVAVSDDNGQWFEIYNTTSRRINLSAVIIRTQDSGGSPVELAIPLPPVLLEPNAHFVVARNSSPAANGGVTADLQFAVMAFAVAGGSISLVASDGSTVIDAVAWDGTWPIATGLLSGYSMSLSPAALAGIPALLNDTRTHWCYAQAQWNPGTDYGSPGAANQPCALDWCNLQWPAATSVIRLSMTENIFGQVYEPPLTTTGDQTPFITAQVGFGANGTMPGAAWTWSSASYNPGFPASQNNEEFMGTMTAPSPPGSYDYAYRMSLDGELSWTLCDLDGSTTNGYTVDQAGDMTVTAGTLFFSEYIEGSSNNKAVEIYNPLPGAASLDGCLMRLYFNGSSTPSTSTIDLAGRSISPGDVFIVCHSSANATIQAACDLASGNLSFNGNDVVELYCGTSSVDIIGRIGEDPGPGTEWGTGLTSTADNTLVRKCAVSVGDTNGADAFDPAAQWDGYAVDTFTYLGSHTTCY